MKTFEAFIFDLVDSISRSENFRDIIVQVVAPEGKPTPVPYKKVHLTVCTEKIVVRSSAINNFAGYESGTSGHLAEITVKLEILSPVYLGGQHYASVFSSLCETVLGGSASHFSAEKLTCGQSVYNSEIGCYSAAVICDFVAIGTFFEE